MRSILLVDDTGLFREAGEAILRRTHCRLIRASSGTEALAAARRERPDMIFLDAAMAGMTGVDVCRVLKADKLFAYTPVILACADEASRQESRRAGAAALLDRPLEEAAFFESIRKYLQIFARDEARALVAWPVTFWRDGMQHEGSIRDLSRGGFFVRTPVRQPIGARLEVAFEVPGTRESGASSGPPAPHSGRTVVAEAIVVRIGPEQDRGLGCRFFRVTAGARVHLEECLRLLEMGEAAAGQSRAAP